MDRNKMIAILSSMGDDALMKAMEANGIPCEGDDYKSGLGPEIMDEAAPWSAIDASIPKSVRPNLIDTSALFNKPAAPQASSDFSFVPPTAQEDEGAAMTGLDMFRG
jgi:hypothetical protein